MPTFSQAIGEFLGEAFASFQQKARATPAFDAEDLISSYGQQYAYAKAGSDIDAQKRADQNSWFLSAVLLIMGETASAKLRIVEKIKGQRDQAFPNHPFEEIYHTPNPYMTGDWMIRYTTLWNKSDGNAYWLLLTDENDVLQEIWPLPSDAVKPVVAEDGSFLSYYEYRARGKIYQIPTDYICHFQNIPNKWNPFDGLSELIAGMLPIDADTAMLRWNAKFFNRDNVMPNAIINLRSGNPARRPAPADIAAIKSDLSSEYAAVNRKTFVTGAPGGIDVSLLGWSARDMDFVAGRASTKKEIFTLMGVPEGVFDPSATEASAKQAAKILKDTVWTRTLVPMGATITQKIIRRFYGKEYEAQYDDIRPVDRELVLKENESKRTVQTFDESRAEVGLEGYRGPFKELIAKLPYELAVNPQFVAEAIKIEKGFYDKPVAKVTPASAQTPPQQKAAHLLRAPFSTTGMLSLDLPYQFAASTMRAPLNLFPDGAEVVPLYQRHITLQFFPILENREAIEAILTSFVSRTAEFEIELLAPECFYNEKDVLHYPVLSSALFALREEIYMALRAENLCPLDTFPTYYPHCTIAYLPENTTPLENLTAPGKLVVSRLTLHWGEETKVFPLTANLALSDLKKWREKVIRAKKAVSFESSYIPQTTHAILAEALATLVDFEPATVKALFLPYVE